MRCSGVVDNGKQTAREELGTKADPSWGSSPPRDDNLELLLVTAQLNLRPFAGETDYGTAEAARVAIELTTDN